MADPRVSVICIFFNEERYITEAIESVLSQDFDDFELLLVDDGSHDGSTAIARRYTAQCPDRISYLHHPDHENRGMSAARNLGLGLARGEYVSFMDGDDRWYPSKLREQVAILDADRAVGMVCGGYKALRGDGNDDWFLSGHVAHRPCYPPETTLKVYPLGWASSPKDPLLRRDVALRVGGYEEQFRGLYEDQAFLSKVYLETGVIFTDDVWLEYRRHDESHTANIGWEAYVATRARFLGWLETYLAGRSVAGEERIRRALRRAQKRARHPMVFRAHRRCRRAWVGLLRRTAFSNTYRRDCTSD